MEKEVELMCRNSSFSQCEMEKERSSSIIKEKSDWEGVSKGVSKGVSEEISEKSSKDSGDSEDSEDLEDLELLNIRKNIFRAFARDIPVDSLDEEEL